MGSRGSSYDDEIALIKIIKSNLEYCIDVDSNFIIKILIDFITAMSRCEIKEISGVDPFLEDYFHKQACQEAYRNAGLLDRAMEACHEDGTYACSIIGKFTELETQY